MAIAKMSRTFTCATAAVAALMVVSAAQAKMIGVNIHKGGNANTLLTSTDVVGAGDAYLAGWYNNIDVDTGDSAINPGELDPYENLKDSDGIATTMDVKINPSSRGLNGVQTLGAAGRWGGDPITDPTKRLYNGGMASGGGRTVEVEILDIPYAIYDLYIYFNYETNKDSFRVQLFEDNDVAGATDTLYMAGGLRWHPKNYLPTEYVQITSTDSNNPTSAGGKGAYAHYTNLTSEDLEFDFWGEQDTKGLAGFQIVEVPEPASLVLIGLGAAALLRRSR